MSCVCIEQSEIGIIEDCGKFDKLAEPGCHCLVPCKHSMAGKMSIRVQNFDCTVESKTKDNVFVYVKVSVQYQVLHRAVDKAFYTLQNPLMQVESYVFNSLRGQIPTFDIDEIFLMRQQIAATLKEEIDGAMDRYGYDILTCLITEVLPARSVQDAMNQIQLYQRLRTAAVDKAEATKIQVVRAAEADAESKRLSGVGLAEQRKAIVAGLQQSVETFQEGLHDLSSEDIMSLLLLNQYFDTLKDVASSSRESTLFISHAGGLETVADQMTQGIIKKKK